jgi:hypothetical protein
MLYDVQLSQRCLIERITRSMYDVTQSVLLRQDEHRVEQALHRLCRLNEIWSGVGDTDKCGVRGNVKERVQTYSMCASSKNKTGIFFVGLGLSFSLPSTWSR